MRTLAPKLKAKAAATIAGTAPKRQKTGARKAQIVARPIALFTTFVGFEEYSGQHRGQLHQ